MNKFWQKFNPSNWFKKQQEETLTPQSNIKLFILEVIKLGFFAIVTIFLVRYFLFKPFYVKGASMEPNFFDKEYLIIDELSYRLRAPERGEIIVFHYPANPSEYFLKRVIGLPGERVKIKDGQVIVYNDQNPDGLVLKENYLPAGLENKPDATYNLDADHYFVLGDNRNSSFDSRFFGPIDKKAIVGKVLLRGLPLNRAQIFSTPSYSN